MLLRKRIARFFSMRYINGNLILRPPPRLGDTVLLEPVLRSFLSKNIPAYADSPYTCIFDGQNWPTKDSSLSDVTVDLTGPWPDGNRVKQYIEVLEGGGIDVDLITQLPRIDNICPQMLMGDLPKLGIVHGAHDSYKIWPYFKLLAKYLSRRFDVHSFDRYKGLTYSTSHVALSMQDLMTYLKAMPLVISNDSGPAHLAAALGTPVLLLSGLNECEKIYEPYGETVQVLESPEKSLSCLSVRTVLKNALALMAVPHVDLPQRGNHPKRIVPAKRRGYALMRMDGLGGTVTLLDQAKKVWESTGDRVTLITRGFEPLLTNHPAVKEVRNIGAVDWFEALRLLQGTYDGLADVRLAVAKWYGKGGRRFKASDELDAYYYRFPRKTAELERYGLHQVQLADKTLGLDASAIETFCYADDGRVKNWFDRPYILLGTGADPWHVGAKHTKEWYGWHELAKLLPFEPVQVGTRYDPPIDGVTDLRGKTSLLELAGLVRRAKLIVCVEGGIMHLAYSCKHPKTIVLRGPTRGKLFEYPGQVQVDSYPCAACWSMTDDWLWTCAERIDGLCMKSITVDRVAYHVERLAA